jgi:diaminopimelate decarboxylase
MVLPVTARINEADHLEIGGCDTVDLVERFGTPLFVFDQRTFVSRCEEYRRSFADGPTPVEIIYAGKAFMCLAACQLLASQGLSLDVSSGGELHVALTAGFPADRIYMHGNNKTPAELKMALEHRIGYVVVDSFNELELLDRLAADMGRRQNIFLRLTPGVKPETHQYIQTGQIDSKFGFGINDGLAERAIKAARGSASLDLIGFHAHIGSQIFDMRHYAEAVAALAEFSAKIMNETGFTVEKLNLGGGLGIKYIDAHEPPSIEGYAAAIFEAIVGQCQKAGLPLPELAIEPGRSIVGNAAVTLYRVGTVKEIPGVRTYVSVDGGMSDNLRPMLYGADYSALVVNKAGYEPTEEVTIAGKHCESGDVLIKDIRLPSVDVGDIICTPATGAYGYAMANNFNMQPRPPVVLVKDGRAEPIIEGETYGDLVRKHRLIKLEG